jgi:glc operon protein GlcG
MTRLTRFAALGAALLSSAGGAQQTAAPAGGNPLDVVPEKMPFDVPYGVPITLERATAAINAAVAEARKRDWKLNVAVVDSGGNLVAFQRMDGAQLGSIQVSEHKARAAVTFRRETKAWENAIQTNGFNYVMTLDGVIASRGGIPLVEGGRIVGGIGCSGGTGSQDEAACKAGVAALQK